MDELLNTIKGAGLYLSSTTADQVREIRKQQRDLLSGRRRRSNLQTKEDVNAKEHEELVEAAMLEHAMAKAEEERLEQLMEAREREILGLPPLTMAKPAAAVPPTEWKGQGHASHRQQGEAVSPDPSTRAAMVHPFQSHAYMSDVAASEQRHESIIRPRAPEEEMSVFAGSTRASGHSSRAEAQFRPSASGPSDSPQSRGAAPLVPTAECAYSSEQSAVDRMGAFLSELPFSTTSLEQQQEQKQRRRRQPYSAQAGGHASSSSSSSSSGNREKPHTISGCHDLEDDSYMDPIARARRLALSETEGYGQGYGQSYGQGHGQSYGQGYGRPQPRSLPAREASPRSNQMPPPVESTPMSSGPPPVSSRRFGIFSAGLDHDSDMAGPSPHQFSEQQHMPSLPVGGRDRELRRQLRNGLPISAFSVQDHGEPTQPVLYDAAAPATAPAVPAVVQLPASAPAAAPTQASSIGRNAVAEFRERQIALGAYTGRATSMAYASVGTDTHEEAVDESAEDADAESCGADKEEELVSVTSLQAASVEMKLTPNEGLSATDRAPSDRAFEQATNPTMARAIGIAQALQSSNRPGLAPTSSSLPRPAQPPAVAEPPAGEAERALASSRKSSRAHRHKPPPSPSGLASPPRARATVKVDPVLEEWIEDLDSDVEELTTNMSGGNGEQWPPPPSSLASGRSYLSPGFFKGMTET